MKIAAICGAPNQNTGMMFVDRALYLYLKKKNLLDNTTFFCFQLEAKNKVGFNYRPLTKEVELNDFDCIIIWGDFIVSNHFLKMTQPKIKIQSEQFNYNLRDKVLMNTFNETDLKKVIVFGQCIVVDGSEILVDDRYLYLLKRLLYNAQLFKVRDPLSAYRAKLFSSKNRDYLGVDSALPNYTLDFERIDEIRNKISADRANSNTIGLFFARSKNINLKKKALGYYLKYKLKEYQYKWIPWLENKQESKEYFSFARDCEPYSDIDYIFEILKCKLIITDTYHLSLMSWSLGIPCICYGKGTEIFKSTIHDKKKEVFFLSNFIDDFYFYTETETFIRDLKNNILKNTISKGINTNIGPIISENIRNLSVKCIKELDRAMDSIRNS